MRGRVKWFDDVKGYGFISQGMGAQDVFVHYSGIEGRGRRTLADNALVEYDTQPGRKGPQAVNVRVIPE